MDVITALGSRPRDRRIAAILCAMFCRFLLAGTGAANASDLDPFGPFGPQGPRMREQLWMLPSGTAGVALRATVFRPVISHAIAAPAPASIEIPRPLVVINHGTSELTRESTGMPVYYWLSRWFVDRGYIVVLPQRRGHGATGGDLAEGGDSCSNPDHYRAGQVAADDIDAVVDYMSGQPFVAKSSTVVVGISTGGWASLALAARNSPQVRAVVNFAGGRGGHAWGQPSLICGAERLIAAAERFGAESVIPTLWLYADNDSYFSPKLAETMSVAWTSAGGKAELYLLPAFRHEGHALADDRAGWQLWGSYLDAFLANLPVKPGPLAAEARAVH